MTRLKTVLPLTSTRSTTLRTWFLHKSTKCGDIQKCSPTPLTKFSMKTLEKHTCSARFACVSMKSMDTQASVVTQVVLPTLAWASLENKNFYP